MPAFPVLDKSAIQELTKFLKTADLDVSDAQMSGAEKADKVEMPVAARTESKIEDQAKYRFTGYQKFLDPDGYPAIAPPVGYAECH